jgi:hypothetical protein
MLPGAKKLDNSAEDNVFELPFQHEIDETDGTATAKGRTKFESGLRSAILTKPMHISFAMLVVIVHLHACGNVIETFVVQSQQGRP